MRELVRLLAYRVDLQRQPHTFSAKRSDLPLIFSNLFFTMLREFLSARKDDMYSVV